MATRAESWYKAIPVRHSIRQFDTSRQIAAETLDQLRSVCQEFRPFRGARAELVTGSSLDGVFKGLIGSYGKINGANAFLAFVGDTMTSHIQEKVGYTGEGVVLEATSLGLGTCWVTGSFKPEVAASLLTKSDSEKILAVSPVGFASSKSSLWERAVKRGVRSEDRLPLESMITGAKSTELPDWTRGAINAARLAPSAKNRQPWSFEVTGDSITVGVRKDGDSSDISKRLDCGIAMLHLEVAITHADVNGKWEFLEAPQVARFKIAEANRPNSRRR